MKPPKVFGCIQSDRLFRQPILDQGFFSEKFFFEGGLYNEQL